MNEEHARRLTKKQKSISERMWRNCNMFFSSKNADLCLRKVFYLSREFHEQHVRYTFLQPSMRQNIMLLKSLIKAILNILHPYCY